MRAGLSDELADGVGERDGGVAEVVGAAEAHEPGAGLDEAAAEQPRQLVEVEVGHRDPVQQLVAADREAAVADRADVERAVGHSVSPPSRSATRTALVTPSSWKPQPQ